MTRRRHPFVVCRSVLIAALAAGGILVAGAAGPREARAEDTAASSSSLLEPPRHRQGYFITTGYHAVLNQNWDHGRAVGVWTGTELTLRMGQMLTRHLGLGLQIDSGSSKKGTETATIFGLSMTAQWEVAFNLALHGGVGLGVVSVSDSADPDADLKGVVGAGYFLGLSYDWFPFKKRLTGGFSVSPMVQARLIPGETYDSLIGLVGVNLGWWTGLPRNQLELPESEAYKKRR